MYLSATKLLLAQGVLLNATLRATKANQNGLLGFGGTAKTSTSVQPEVSVAWLLRRDLAIGAEYRAKPDNLNPSPLGAGLKEDDWADVFLAWAPTKHLSLTLAYVDLGRIVPAVATRRQSGVYLSAQVAYLRSHSMKLLNACAALLLCIGSLGAAAQTAAPPADDALYQRLWRAKRTGHTDGRLHASPAGRPAHASVLQGREPGST